MMHQARVPFLAGTDVQNPYCFPGFSLHDELVLLVQAGLAPMEALQAATRNPARFLGKEKEIGTVEKGKIADLVLLEANPLEDIRNTTKINSVVLNGRLLDRKALDQLLAERWASGRLEAGSEARADAGSRRLHALVRRRLARLASHPSCFGYSSNTTSEGSQESFFRPAPME